LLKFGKPNTHRAGGPGEPTFNTDEMTFTGDLGMPSARSVLPRPFGLITTFPLIVIKHGETTPLASDLGSWRFVGFDRVRPLTGFWVIRMERGIALATAFGDPGKAVAK